jgi:acetyltransferase
MTSPSIGSSTGESSALSVFFAPKSVAVIGASEKAGSVGRNILWNLISSPFGGTVYPVNAKRGTVLGIKAYPSIAAVPGPVDLAVIITPANTVAGLVRECGAHGVKGVVVISAGFRETGPEGAELERQVVAEARRAGIRLIGPNCLGVMCPITGLNATFAPTMAKPGNVGFLSQSGALCTAVLDWSLREQVGFSAFMSTGAMADVNWGDLIDHLGSDPSTRSIVIYMESVVDARSFLSAAREVALQKPIIVIKAGRTKEGTKAASSHTGSLAGSDDVLDAAFRRCGVLRVDTIGEMFDMVEVLGRQPRPKGPKLLILTNAGGPGVLATDALLTGGGALAGLSEETMAAFNAVLPQHWSHANPVDVIGDADADRYVKSVEIAAREKDADGLLVIMTPQGMTDPVKIAEGLKNYAALPGKPVLASWMGGFEAAPGEAILNAAGIPTFPFPDAAVRAFLLMAKYSYNLQALYETPLLVEDRSAPNAQLQISAELREIRDQGRTILTEFEAKEVFKAYGIPVVETKIATSQAEAVAYAEELGYPVVLKLHSETITHKTDVGGVQLNLGDQAAVARAYQAIQDSVTAKVGAQHFDGVTVQKMVRSNGAYELILGSSIDAQFGPVLLFGTGGQLVEVFEDRSLAIPPLNTTLARRMMEQTRIYKALQGVRGRKPVDLPRLERLLVRFSQLVMEQPWIKEIDINPLLVSAEDIIALDARIILHDKGTPESALPKPAIRPYPSQYAKEIMMDSKPSIRIRPIRPEDEPLIVAFHGTLSERSVYMRYFSWMKLGQRIAHDRLARICFIDYDRQIALVAESTNEHTGERQISGVGRLVKSSGGKEAEVAFIISDACQGHGIGHEMMALLVGFARDEKLTALTATFIRENLPMRRLLERFKFEITDDIKEDSSTARLEL